jgi:hypothetical protein
MTIGLYHRHATELNCKSNTRGCLRFLPGGALRGITIDLEAEIYACPIAALRGRAARQNALAVPAQVEPGLVKAEASRQHDLVAALGGEAEVLAATARGSAGGIAVATTARRSGGCLGLCALMGPHADPSSQ